MLPATSRFLPVGKPPGPGIGGGPSRVITLPSLWHASRRAQGAQHCPCDSATLTKAAVCLDLLSLPSLSPIVELEWGWGAQQGAWPIQNMGEGGAASALKWGLKPRLGVLEASASSNDGAQMEERTASLTSPQLLSETLFGAPRTGCIRLVPTRGGAGSTCIRFQKQRGWEGLQWLPGSSRPSPEAPAVELLS